MKLLSALTLAATALLLACTVQQNEQAQRDKEAYQQQIRNRLAELDRETQQLEAQLKNTSGETRTQIDREIAALNRYKETARKNLAELEAATVEGWENLRAGTDQALSAVENAAKNMRQYTKQ